VFILWIGTQRSGLNAFNYQTNQQIIYQHDKKNPNSICTNDITGIYPTSDGNLWITTYWQGIDYLDKKTGKFTHYNQTTIPELPSNTVWTLLDDNKGNLYIGHHAENGMSILSLKTKKVKNFTHDPNNKKTLPHNNVQCIFKDNTGNIWAGTGRGLALFNPNTEEFIWLGEKNPSLSHLVYDIQQFNENQLWVATELGGIAIIDLSKTLFNTAEEIHVIQAGNNEHNLTGTDQTMFAVVKLFLGWDWHDFIESPKTKEIAPIIMRATDIETNTEYYLTRKATDIPENVLD